MTDSTVPIDPEVVRLQSRMFAHRLKLGKVLGRARLGRQAWWRWTQGAEPKLHNLRRLEQAIDSLIAEKEATHGAPSRSEEEDPTSPAG